MHQRQHQHQHRDLATADIGNLAMDPTATNDVPYYMPPTQTSTAADSMYTCDPNESFFLNSCYLSRFTRVISQYSGLTNLDIDLYNRCYLPYNALSYDTKKAKRDGESWVSVQIEKPDYQQEVAPCKRMGAIGANCYWKNTNGTFSGLDKYQDDFGQQQNCYCKIYPFWDATAGCMKCLEMHGGIEGMYAVGLVE